MREQESYLSADEPIVISKLTSDLLLKSSNPSDNMALYWFYYQTAKWQNTFTVRATTKYVITGLKWSEQRFFRAKKELMNMNLIKCVAKRKGGSFDQFFIKIFIIGTQQQNSEDEQVRIPRSRRSSNAPTSTHDPAVLVNPSTNAYSTNSLNAYSTNNLILTQKIAELESELKLLKSEQIPINEERTLFPKEVPITVSMFPLAWSIYPKKVEKGKALAAWEKLVTQKNKGKVRPTWETVKNALENQKKSELWVELPQYIPNFASWINAYGWLNDPKEMKVFKKQPPKQNGYAGFVGKEINYQEPITM